jgi:hypothetical protein
MAGAGAGERASLRGSGRSSCDARRVRDIASVDIGRSLDFEVRLSPISALVVPYAIATRHESLFSYAAGRPTAGEGAGCRTLTRWRAAHAVAPGRLPRRRLEWGL